MPAGRIPHLPRCTSQATCSVERGAGRGVDRGRAAVGPSCWLARVWSRFPGPPGRRARHARVAHVRRSVIQRRETADMTPSSLPCDGWGYRRLSSWTQTIPCGVITRHEPGHTVPVTCVTSRSRSWMDRREGTPWRQRHTQSEHVHRLRFRLRSSPSLCSGPHQRRDVDRGRSYWISGSYTPTASEKRSPF